MTDYYKMSLEILIDLLKKEGYDHWAKWMQEDITLWETSKSTEHHLNAYGGMGSFNDVPMGTNTIEGLWTARIFGTFQTFAWSLAKGKKMKAILKEMQSSSTQISGWRCRTCGEARINTQDIERYVVSFVLPKLLQTYVFEDKLDQITDLSTLLTSPAIIDTRKAIEILISNAHIIINTDTQWQWICPTCKSEETCSYRWEILQDNTLIEEAADNLAIQKK
jgi:hypothetical protein